MAYTIPWSYDPFYKRKLYDQKDKTSDAIQALQQVSGTMPVSDIPYDVGDAGVQLKRNIFDPFTTEKNMPVTDPKVMTALGQINAGNKKVYTADELKAMSSDEFKGLFGTTDIKSQINKKYALPDGMGKNLGSLVKPALGVGTVLMNLQKLKDTRDAAKGIQAPRVDAAVTGVRPIQDITPEMLNTFFKQLGGMQTQKTSDAVANIMGEQMLSQQKLDALGALGAHRAENLQAERSRYDEDTARNAIASVEARNEQAKVAMDIANRKAEIDAAYEAEKQAMWNAVSSSAQEGIHQRVMYNMAAEIQNREAAKQKLATVINQTERMLAVATDLGTKQRLQKTLTDLMTKYQTEDYSGYQPKFKLPSYGGLMARAFRPQLKKGGKLLPRK